ncbi:hypothetical protein CBL_12345 [Carabus blaptoides fortunei]
MAVWDWLKSFMKGHPTLCLRTPEATSSARAQAFNPDQIYKYFDSLDTLLSNTNIGPENIWIVDESGFSIVLSKPLKIIATKGRKQVGAVTSAEWGQRFSIVCCMSAIGSYIPPAFIFPRKNMKIQLLDNAPVESVEFGQEKGWMTSEIFLKWLKHFIKYSKATPDNKILLLLEGHCSHKSLEVIEYAKNNGIVVFCFPPHCTHRVQPLDESFYGPLTSYYNSALTNWMKAHPGRTVSYYQVGSIFKEAYLKAATLSNAEKGFSSTGIYPFNKDVFPEWMFSPADVTNINEELKNSNFKSSAELKITAISPLPKGLPKTNRKCRNKGKTGILNDSRAIEDLEKKEIEKNAERTRKSSRQIKRRLNFSHDADEDALDSNAEDDEEDVPCLYCNELFSKSRSGEQWLQCQVCSKWCHTDCAGVSKKQKNV